MRGVGQTSPIIAALCPFDLEARVGHPHHTGDLDRDALLSDRRERIGGPSIGVEEERGAVGGEIIGLQPVSASQHGIGGDGPDVGDEMAEIPGDLPVTGPIVADRRGDASRLAQAIDFDHKLEDWFSNCDGPAPCVSMLDGYLAAIIVSPEFVPPHVWLRAIVSEELVDAPDHTLEGVVRNTIFKRYNQISSTLTGGPKRYAPIFRRTDNEEVLLEPYADGFWHGMRLTLDDWKPFISNHDIGMPLTAILGHCTTMINDEDRAALRIHPAATALR